MPKPDTKPARAAQEKPVTPAEYRARRPPTDRQMACLLKLREYFVEFGGLSPSYREFARYCNVKSVRTVQEHLYALEKKGLIERLPHEWRSFWITKMGDKYINEANRAKLVKIRLATL